MRQDVTGDPQLGPLVLTNLVWLISKPEQHLRRDDQKA